MSGGSSAPTEQTVTQVSVPEYLRPYVESNVGRTAALTDWGSNPYQPYGGQRVAGFAPEQVQAFQNIAGMEVAPQIGDASSMAAGAGQSGMNAVQQSGRLQEAGLGYGARAGQIGDTAPAMGLRGMDVGQIGVNMSGQGFGAQGAYERAATDPSQFSQFMSPYMQNVVDVHKREIDRDYQKQLNQAQAQAVGQSAFGGSRSALVQSELARDAGQRMSDAQLQGLQSAYQQAQQAQQFGADLGIRGLQAGYQGLDLGLQGVQAGIAGAQTGILGQQAGIQGVNAATNAGQYGLQGGQLANQSAATLGNLGQMQFQQEMAMNQALAGAGQQRQQLQQLGLDTQHQDYLAQLQYPYQQAAFMQGIYQGLPMNQGTASVYQNPNPVSQMAGLGTAAYGLSSLTNSRKAGGLIQTPQSGLVGLALRNTMGGKHAHH